MKISLTTITTHNLSARLIHLGMWIYAKLRNKPTRHIDNHFEIRIGEDTWGAISEGVTKRHWQKYVNEHKGKYFTYTNRWFDLTDEELQRGLKFLESQEGTPYEFENFWWFTVYIFTGKWKGSTSFNKIYCYELGIAFINAAKGWNLNEQMSPYEFYEWNDKFLQ